MTKKLTTKQLKSLREKLGALGSGSKKKTAKELGITTSTFATLISHGHISERHIDKVINWIENN